MTLSSVVWIQSINVTDGRTLGDGKDRAYALRRAVKIVGDKCEQAVSWHTPHRKMTRTAETLWDCMGGKLMCVRFVISARIYGNYKL